MDILFITSGSIGDAIISTSLLAYLLDTYPEAVFTIVAGPASVPLFSAFPRLKKLITLRKLPWNRHWPKLWLSVCSQRWGMVVDLRGGAISYLLRAKERRIFFKPDKTQSKAQQLAALFNLPEPYLTRLWTTEAARRQADALVGDAPFIVMAPKTNSAAKDWPIERFAELAQKLCGMEYTLVVLASAAQQASVQPLVKALPGGYVRDLSGATDLLTAYAVLERAELFIGNDSGLLHMAAAAGIPCIGIYGPSNDKIYAPRGEHVNIITAVDFAPGEREKKDNAYMQMISVERVLQVVPELPKATPQSHAQHT